MTRIDLPTSSLHDLLKPVLPHAGRDDDNPAICVVRLELSEACAYAIATDRYSLAAERLLLDETCWEIPQPIHLRADELTAALKLFPHRKHYDPTLKLTIDQVPVTISQVGRSLSVNRLGLTLESLLEGTKLTLHDVRDPSADPLGSWRKQLANVFHRPLTESAPAVYLNASMLTRWQAAVRGIERLALFTGRDGDMPLLIAVEHHFLGMWQPIAYLDSPAQMLSDAPWVSELGENPRLAQEGREHVTDETTEQTTADVAEGGDETTGFTADTDAADADNSAADDGE